VKKLLKAVLIKFRIYGNTQEKYGWFGNYKTWQRAEIECTGYDNTEILNKVKESVLKVKNGKAVYERDSVLFEKIEISEQLLNAFLSSVNNNSLHIVDFGGSLGSSYFQHKKFLESITDFKWGLVEQKHFVEVGKKEIEDKTLKFFFTIDEALIYCKPQILLVSSVIQYFEKPYELIESFIKYNFKYIIIDRTAFLNSDCERITKQMVPSEIYRASYPSWFLNEKKFINAFEKKYDLIYSFSSGFDPEENLEDGTLSYRKGFYFKLK
jgi:putative methyltransferase (TIGR04325 family)